MERDRVLGVTASAEAPESQRREVLCLHSGTRIAFQVHNEPVFTLTMKMKMTAMTQTTVNAREELRDRAQYKIDGLVRKQVLKSRLCFQAVRLGQTESGPKTPANFCSFDS